jgi:hypothetical protein
LEQGGGTWISLKTGANSAAFLATQPEIRSVLETFTQDKSQMDSIDMSTVVCYPKSDGWLAKVFEKYFPISDSDSAERIIEGIISKNSIVKVRFHLNMMAMFCSFVRFHYISFLNFCNKTESLQ